MTNIITRAADFIDNEAECLRESCTLSEDGMKRYEVEDNRTVTQKLRYWLHCKTYRLRLKCCRRLGISDPIPF